MSEHHHNGDGCGCGHNHEKKCDGACQGHGTVPSTKVLKDGRVDCNPSDPLKVVKTITKEGLGDTPSTGSIVNVHYVGTLENGTKFDSSRDRNQPVFDII
jgi:FKBP-type peptidyl-prolyl cis-trans isomerase